MNDKSDGILLFFVITIIAVLVYVFITDNDAVAKIENTEATANKESLESINNDLKMIQHIVKYAKEDAIETFNNSLPIPQGRFKAKDTTPLRIHDGLVDIDSLVVDIENKLNNLDYE